MGQKTTLSIVLREVSLAKPEKKFTKPTINPDQKNVKPLK